MELFLTPPFCMKGRTQNDVNLACVVCVPTQKFYPSALNRGQRTTYNCPQPKRIVYNSTKINLKYEIFISFRFT